MSNSEKDLKKYYEILEINSDASEEDITRAYKYLKTLYSSDSAAISPIDDEWDGADRCEILDQVEEAYTQLMAPAQIEEEPVEAADVAVEEQQPEEEFVEAAGITVEEKQPEEEPIFIELDEEEIPVESMDEEEIEPENLVEIEIPSEFLEEEIPVEGKEEEEAPAESPDMDDTKPEVLIVEEPISGMALRKIRKNQGLTIQELADSTQIPKIIVGYIEREEYSKLPDAGYLRWYITTYASAFSLDPKDTADQYMKRYRQWKKDQ
jgi:hypothetical protein